MLVSPTLFAASLPEFHTPLVITYHDIVAEVIPGTTATEDVLNTEFPKQLDYIREHFVSISLEDCFQYRAKGKKIPVNAIVITFDDGYQGQVDYAVPELKKRGLKASFFIHTNFVGIPRYDSVPTSRDHGSWADWIRIDRDRLFDVQSHTFSHRSLSRNNPPLNEVHLDSELRGSKEVLERILRKKKDFIVYPYGDHDAKSIASARRFYKMGFAFGDPDSEIDPIFQIPRFKMGRHLTQENFSTLLSEWVNGIPGPPPPRD